MFRKSGITVMLVAIGLSAMRMVAANPERNTQSLNDLQQRERIRKELATLPYYGVFDNLSFEVTGGTVILTGQVVRPITRSGAEQRVRKTAGVTNVINNIEVLPLSTFDEAIRVRAYRAVFRTGGLSRYAMGVNPAIHIVVNNGHVTLEGVVSSASDSQTAFIAANGLSGVFSVTNNLRVEHART